MISHPPELVKNLRKVEETTDRLGNPIDEDIKLLVAALWSHDVPTSNSCADNVDELRKSLVSDKTGSVFGYDVRYAVIECKSNTPGSKRYDPSTYGMAT